MYYACISGTYPQVSTPFHISLSQPALSENLHELIMTIPYLELDLTDALQSFVEVGVAMDGVGRSYVPIMGQPYPTSPLVGGVSAASCVDVLMMTV